MSERSSGTQNTQCLKHLHRAGRAVAAAQNEQGVGQALMGFAASSGAQTARLLLFTDFVDGQPSAFELRESWTEDDRSVPDYGSQFAWRDYPFLASIDAQEPLLCQELTAGGHIDDNTCDLVSLSDQGALMVVPLVARHNGTDESTELWLGVVLIGRDSPADYAEDLIYAWRTLANQAASALENLQLLSQEARHQMLLNSIQTPVLALRDDMSILYCNEAYANFIGQAVSDLVGNKLLAMFPWMAETKSYQAYLRALETGEPQEAEGKFGDRYLLARVYRTPWGIIAVLEDTTERRRLMADLEDRALQLQTAAEVARAASSILDPEELIQRVVDLARERFDLYYAGLFLVDRTGEWTGEPDRWAVLQAGTGEAGRQMMAAEHKLEIGGDSMIGWCVAYNRARIALDVGEEAVRFDNPFLPETRSEMALPLISRGEAIGAMTIQSTQPAAFDEQDIVILQTMSDQLANAIENARLFKERERRVAEQTIVSQIGQELSAALELDELLNVVYQQVSRVFDTTNFYIATYQEGEPEWVSALHYERGEQQPVAHYPVSSGLTGYIIRNRRMLCLSNVEENRAFHQQQGSEAIGEPAKSWLGVPLIAADKVVGVMGVQSYEIENLYHQQHVTLFSTIADQVANAIENARLYEEVRSRAERLAVINRIGSAVSAVLDLDELVETVRQEVVTVFEPDAFFVAFYEEGDKTLHFVLREEDGERLPSDRRSLGEGLTTTVVLEKSPLLIQNFEQEKDRLPPAKLWGTEAPPTWLGVPICIGERVLGVISVQSYRAYAYGEEEQLLLSTIADQVAVALETQQLYAQEQERRQQAEAVARIGQTLVSTLELDAALPAVLEQSAQIMGVRQCGVIILDQEAGVGNLVAEYRQGAGTISEPVQIPIAGNLSMQKIIETRQPLAIWNAETDPLMAPIRDVVEKRGIKSILIVPMLVGGRLIGTIGFDSLDQPRRFSDEEIQLALTLAGQLAAAIENSRLLEEQQRASSLMKERVKALDCLNDIGRKIDETPPVPELLAWLAERIPSAMRHPEECVVAVQFNGQTYGATEALDLPRQMTGGLRAGGQLVGKVLIAYTQEREFIDEDSALLGDIVRRVSGYIENRRLFEQAQQQLADLSAIQQTTSKLILASTFEEAVSMLLPQLGSAIQADQISLFLVQGEHMTRVGSYSADEAEEAARVGDRLLLADYPLTQRVIETGQPLALTADDPRLQEHARQAFRASGITASATIPLVSREGVVGTLSVSLKRPGRTFSDHDVNLMQTLADQAIVSFERLRLLEETGERARREQTLRQVTARVRGSTNPDIIVRAAVRELGNALGRPAFIRLGSAETLQPVSAEGEESHA